MSQIEVTVLKEGTRSKHVISVSFFTMPGAYRSVEIYQKNLRGFLYKTKKLENFEVRIYTDSTGKDFALDLANNNSQVTVLQYDCPFFREGKGHTGTFGAITRFLPLFEKDLETVWISDIDVDYRFISKDLLNMMEKNNVDVFVDSVVCYERKPWAHVKQPIIAHRFISKVRFSKQILTNFLNGLMTGKYIDYISEINEYNERKTPNDKFPYGMDEAFINGPIYNSIKRNDLKIIVRKDFFTQTFLVYGIEGFPEKDTNILKTYYKTHNLELFKKVKEIYKRYIPMILEKYPCMQELLDNMSEFKDSFEVFFLANSKDF